MSTYERETEKARNMRREKDKIVEFIIITTYITSIGCTLIIVYQVHTSFIYYIYPMFLVAIIYIVM